MSLARILHATACSISGLVQSWVTFWRRGSVGNGLRAAPNWAERHGGRSLQRCCRTSAETRSCRLEIRLLAILLGCLLLPVHGAWGNDPPQTNSVPQLWQAKLFGMRGFPAIPPGMTEAQFFPLIDKFGQYRHADWPGKTHGARELADKKNAEADDLTRHPGPADWDTYGGWKAGPQLAATGRFRAEKHDGKWWLVDPEGRLFWSQGIDCVDMSWSTTPITDRRQWFARLPAKDSPDGKFYGRGDWGPHNYYEGKSYETFDFTAVNLRRKYGEDWGRQFPEVLHRRLRSWGLNTIGNWSDASIYQMRKTPYVVTIGSSGRTLAGSQGYWGKFADVFDPGFAASIRAAAQRHQAVSANDPWCLGYFVDNELSWGDELSLATAALASPADQPAKQVFLADLRAKYGSIEALNAAWGTHYASWEALPASRTVPSVKRAYTDLAAFASKTAEQYFRTCRDEVKRSAPASFTWAAVSPGSTTARSVPQASSATWSVSIVIRRALPICDCPRALTARSSSASSISERWIAACFIPAWWRQPVKKTGPMPIAATSTARLGIRRLSVCIGFSLATRRSRVAATARTTRSVLSTFATRPMRR